MATYEQDPNELDRMGLRWLLDQLHDLTMRELLSVGRLPALPPAAPLHAADYLMLLAIGETMSRLATSSRYDVVHKARVTGASWALIGRAIGADPEDARIMYLHWIDGQAWRRDAEGQAAERRAHELARADEPPADRRSDPLMDLRSDEPGVAAAAAEQLEDAEPGGILSADRIEQLVTEARQKAARSEYEGFPTGEETPPDAAVGVVPLPVRTPGVQLAASVADVGGAMRSEWFKPGQVQA